MNVFGAFTFGSLIKTFIPGLVWVLALGLLTRDLHHWWPEIVPALPAITGEEQTFLVLAVPASILFGLVSNIIVFMGVNDVLIRNPVRRGNVPLFELYDGLCAQKLDRHWERMHCAKPALAPLFRTHADPEILTLQTTGINDLAYIREQYWYHMEFQVNMLLAVFATLLAVLLSSALLGASWSWAHLLRAGAAILALGGLCILFQRAALKNYARHVAKICSLLAVDLGGDVAEQPAEALP